MLTTALVISVLPAVIFAQYGGPYGGPAPSSSPTTSGAVAVSVPSAPADSPGHVNVRRIIHPMLMSLGLNIAIIMQVDVAFQETFTFHPNNFTAPNGTQVTFWFPNTGLNHSVTQSSFNNPCTYLAASGNTSAGFDSGLQSAVTFTITIVDDTKPIWFHCKQVQHCGMGMVGSINAPSTGNTFDAFHQAALKIGSSEVTETDNGPMTGGVNGIATALPASSTGGSSSAGNSSSSGSSNSTSDSTSTGNSTSGSLALVLLMA
ncbi:hypothetical protein C0995_012409 [Termitomyces sp. Mi166|nr:hypothetical protein C0995_012409 [Termitomyces sp. Mi166\